MELIGLYTKRLLDEEYLFTYALSAPFPALPLLHPLRFLLPFFAVGLILENWKLWENWLKIGHLPSNGSAQSRLLRPIGPCFTAYSDGSNAPSPPRPPTLPPPSHHLLCCCICQSGRNILISTSRSHRTMSRYLRHFPRLSRPFLPAQTMKDKDRVLQFHRTLELPLPSPLTP